MGPFRKQVGANVEFYFEGISPKSVSPAISTPAPNSPTVTAASSAVSAAPGIEVPGSPILKAQLCAPPKAVRKDNAKQVIYETSLLVLFLRYVCFSTLSSFPLRYCRRFFDLFYYYFIFNYLVIRIFCLLFYLNRFVHFPSCESGLLGSSSWLTHTCHKR